jgi:uncharacterized membrane protein
MILMAIDHVRVYAGVPAGGSTPDVFFTRWITHFCAPAFVFLAGTSAFLYRRSHRGVSRFLLTRGLWLVLLELTFLRVAWTFNFDFAHYLLAGVIWVIGWSMVAMAVLVRLPVALVGAVGVAIIAGHNLLDPGVRTFMERWAEGPTPAVWKLLYLGFLVGPVRLGAAGPDLAVLYSFVPWVGVMAAGYAFGSVLVMELARRDRLCLAIGLGATALFLVLRSFNLYGDPRSWSPPSPPGPVGRPPMPAALAFLNTTKYPASLLFLLMTLGPTIALMAALERVRGALPRMVTVFGRVPFFFYMLHIPLIHALALVVSRIRLGEVSPWLFTNHPMGNPPPPDGYPWSLPLLYMVWAVAIALLYPACRWFADLKARRRDPWLSYV